MRKWVIASLALLLSASSSPATIFMWLTDDIDDQLLIRDVYDQKDVAKFRLKLEKFEKKLSPLKEKDFIDLFGNSQDKPKNTYVMPVAQVRQFGLSGWLKHHLRFYIIKDFAAIEVYYYDEFRGVVPAAIIVHFRTDKDFPKLTKDNLAKRLAWDDEHWKKLSAYCDKRLREVFPWEVDQKELARIQQGDFAVDVKVKLAAWIESGKLLGYKCRHDEGSNEWSWYRPNGTKAREASTWDKESPRGAFYWYHEDGSSKLREETIGQRHTIDTRRWQQPKNTFNIRFEQRGIWCWYDKDGKPVRQEWDDNGDGIPDWYIAKEDNIAHVGDRSAEKKRKPLKIDESWAINPKLIPEESRIPDQPDLRVPIRRKGIPETAKKDIDGKSESRSQIDG